MLKIVSFKNVNFNEVFSHGGDIYQKIIRDTLKPGAVRLSDGMVFNSCQNWFHCTVEREDVPATLLPKERKKYLFRDEDYGDVHGLLLTDEQMAFCRWLDEHSYLRELTWEQVDGLDFTEI
jgi:hypothetical protein